MLREHQQPLAVPDLVALAGNRVHLERERALGRVEELLDATGEPQLARRCCSRPIAAAATACDCDCPPAGETPRLPPPPNEMAGSGSPERAELLAELGAGAQQLTAGVEWEQRLGGLRLARLVLQRRGSSSARTDDDDAFAGAMMDTCERLLEDPEVRVRWAVSEGGRQQRGRLHMGRGRYGGAQEVEDESPPPSTLHRTRIVTCAGWGAAAHAVRAAGHRGLGTHAGLPAAQHTQQL